MNSSPQLTSSQYQDDSIFFDLEWLLIYVVVKEEKNSLVFVFPFIHLMQVAV